MKKNKKRRYIKPLFFRIFFSITLPFICLFLIFSYIILKQNAASFRHLEEELAFSAVHHFEHQYSEALRDPKTIADPKVFFQTIDELRKASSAEWIGVTDAGKSGSILSSSPRAGSPEVPDEAWLSSTKQTLQIQKTLSVMREGSAFYLFPDETEGKLYVYFPFRQPVNNTYLIAILRFHLTTLQDSFKEVSKMYFLIFVLCLLTALAISLALTYHVVHPVLSMNRAFREILDGNLGKKVTVKTGDEIELLASNFNRVSQAMLVMTHVAGDSNPLTQLPGNQIIREEATRRLNEGLKFVFFHVDIDHFKAYNDEYGLSKGDDVLRRTSAILTEAVKNFDGNNFVGHQGGDDFILILEISQAEKIGQIVCNKFDESMKDFYTAEDLARGYFMGKESRNYGISEDTDVKRQPLMSISLAGVSNLKRPYHAFEDVLEHSINVKKRAKKLPYSVFLIEE